MLKVKCARSLSVLVFRSPDLGGEVLTKVGWGSLKHRKRQQTPFSRSATIGVTLIAGVSISTKKNGYKALSIEFTPHRLNASCCNQLPTSFLGLSSCTATQRKAILPVCKSRAANRGINATVSCEYRLSAAVSSRAGTKLCSKQLQISCKYLAAAPPALRHRGANSA